MTPALFFFLKIPKLSKNEPTNASTIIILIKDIREEQKG